MSSEPSIDVLSAYVDQELSGVARQELEAHLKDCETCRRRLEAMRQTVHAIHALPMEPPPRVFTIPAQRQQPSRFAPIGAWAGGLAAVAIVGLIVTVALHSPHATGGSTAAGPATLSINSAHQQKGATAPAAGAGIADQSLGSAFAPSNLVSQTVADPKDPATTLRLVAQQAVPANGTLAIGVTVTGSASSASLHLSLVRNGYGVPIPWSAPAAQVSGSEYLALSQLPLPSPRTGQYQLIAVADLPSGDELIATVPVQVR
jgi:anti-sigma factor RsiW